jgi:hypothetical protein
MGSLEAGNMPAPQAFLAVSIYSIFLCYARYLDPPKSPLKRGTLLVPPAIPPSPPFERGVGGIGGEGGIARSALYFIRRPSAVKSKL